MRFSRRMNIFGRPGSPKNALYRKYRLKIRNYDETRQTFAAEVAQKARAVGLTVSEWIPVWDWLLEEAQIPGSGRCPASNPSSSPRFSLEAAALRPRLVSGEGQHRAQ
jgi:hypothetical protein